MSARLCCIVTALLGWIILAMPAWSLDCSNPPTGFGNAWWSEYASWCSACGGTPDAGTVSCTPGANWGGSSQSGGMASGPQLYTGDMATDLSFYMMQQTLPIFFDAIGQQIACEFDPNCPRKVYERQLRQQLEQARQSRLRAEAMERERREIERRARFEQERRSLLDEMRLQETGNLKSRNLTLETREVGSTLGASVLAPRDLSQTGVLGSTSIRSPLARAQCGVYLLRQSEQAAARGDFQEAAFLSNEAAALIAGEKFTSAVLCPAPPSVPQVDEGREVVTAESRRKSQEIQLALQKRSQFVQGMYQRVAEQGQRYRDNQQAITEAEENRQRAQQKVEQAQAVLVEFKPRKTDAAPLPGPANASAAKPAQDPAAASAMAEALAALADAQAALDQANTTLEEAVDEKGVLEQQMQTTRSLLEQVKKDPESLDNALQTLAKQEDNP